MAETLRHRPPRHLARILADELPGAPYVYTNRLVEGRSRSWSGLSEAEHARSQDEAGLTRLSSRTDGS